MTATDVILFELGAIAGFVLVQALLLLAPRDVPDLVHESYNDILELTKASRGAETRHGDGGTGKERAAARTADPGCCAA